MSVGVVRVVGFLVGPVVHRARLTAAAASAAPAAWRCWRRSGAPRPESAPIKLTPMSSAASGRRLPSSRSERTVLGLAVLTQSIPTHEWEDFTMSNAKHPTKRKHGAKAVPVLACIMQRK